MTVAPRFVLPYQTVIGPTGVPLNGALLNFYLTGSRIRSPTYSDAGLVHANPNPVEALTNGQFPNIFLDPSVTYKVVLTDSSGAVIWTADPVSGASGGGGGAAFQIAANLGELRTQSPLDGSLVFLLGVNQTGDGGEGWWFYDATDTTTADNIGTVVIGAGGARWKRAWAGWYQVDWWGMKAAAGQDDSAAGQAAIDYVSSIGGGTLQWTTGKNYRGNWVLKNGVSLIGDSGIFGWTGGGPAPKTQLTAFASVPVIDTPDGQIIGASVSGFSIIGLGNLMTGTDIGMRLKATRWCGFTNLLFRNFGNQGLLALADVASQFERILATNCLLDTTIVVDAGVIDLTGTDSYLNIIEATTSQAALSGGGHHLIAVRFNIANGMMNEVVGELSDLGIVVLGDFVRATNSRADTNFAHGWVLSGASQGLFSACLGFNNGQAAANTYDNWNIDNTGGNHFSACIGIWDGTGVAPRYGFNDAVNTSTNLAGRNIYDGSCGGAGNASGTWGLTDFGSMVTLPDGPWLSFAAADTTPSVAGAQRFLCAIGSIVSITNFTNGIPGQHIYVWFYDGDATIKNGATIKTLGAADITPHARSILRFDYHGGVWYQDGIATA